MEGEVERKKSGYPDASLVSSPLHLQKFTILCRYLNEALGVPATEQLLSQFVYNLQYVMEAKFGKGCKPPKKLTKIPHSVFRDYRIRGGLCTVFEASSKLAKLSDWVKTDLVADSNFETLFKLLSSIKASLLERGLISRPLFFFCKSVRERPHGEKLVRDLTAIVEAHDGEVSKSEEKASFVVKWDEEVDGVNPDLQDEYIRPLEFRPNESNGIAFVHWWYYPDSYDEWIPSRDVQCNDVPDLTSYKQLIEQTGEYNPRVGIPSTKSHVCCRFLHDVNVFNEWGNVLDYELDLPDGVSDVDMTSPTRKSRSKKRSSIDRRQHSIPRQHAGGAGVAQAVNVTEKMLQDLPPPSVHDPNNKWSYNGNAEETINVVQVSSGNPCSVSQESQRQVLNGIAEAKESVEEEDSSDLKRKREDSGDKLENKKINLDVTAQRDDSENRHNELEEKAVLEPLLPPTDLSQLYTAGLPSWFDVKAISAVEMRYIPEVILGYRSFSENSSEENEPNSSPQVVTASRPGQKYVAMRNRIVHLYQQKVGMFLTATECRRKIAGDAGYIIRVHEFLDAFGVINYSPKIKDVFRHPRSAMFFSHNRSSPMIKTENGCHQKQTFWTPLLDEALLGAVGDVMKGSSGKVASNGTAESSHEVGGVDWKQVADRVSTHVEEERKVQITSVACLMRFTEMNLTGQNKIECEGKCNIADNHMVCASKMTRHLSSLASAAFSSVSHQFSMSDIQRVSEAIKPALQVSNAANTSVATVTSNAVMISTASKGALDQKLSQAEGYINDYISLRLSVLERKMDLLGHIEDALLVEKNRLALDRHDLQVERAQHASYVQAEARIGMY